MPASTSSELYLGLMSGTSADGVDCALVEVTSPRDEDFEARLVAFRFEPFPGELTARVHALAVPARAPEVGASPEAGAPPPPDALDRLLALDDELGERFLQAAQRLLSEAGVEAAAVTAVGHHGQTVRHRPPRRPGARGQTLQIGNAGLLVEGLGVPVVSDFRTRDMALGGQGAPLVPLFDRLALGDPEGPVAALNLGGIANLTGLPARGGAGRALAFDTGPANAWMDAACRAAALPEGYDAGGARARAGTVDEDALAAWLAHPYLALPPPKSTGLEEFGADALPPWPADRSLEDQLATLAELTARTVADGLAVLERELGPLRAVYAAGGGCANAFLMERLRAAYPRAEWRALADRGVPPEAKEAFCFAVLAARTMHGLPGNLPEVTGASRATVLGQVSRPT